MYIMNKPLGIDRILMKKSLVRNLPTIGSHRITEHTGSECGIQFALFTGHIYISPIYSCIYIYIYICHSEVVCSRFM